MLTGVDLTQSLALAEEFRVAIESLRVVSEGHTVAFTASFGVVSTVPHATLQIEDLLAAADRALYEVKHNGRNCVRAALIGT